MALIPVSGQFIQAISPLLDVSDAFLRLFTTFVSLSRVTVRSALYLRRLYQFYFTSAVFYVTLSLFMSLSVRLGRIISISGSIRTLCTIGLASLAISHRLLSFLFIYDASFYRNSFLILLFILSSYIFR